MGDKEILQFLSYINMLHNKAFIENAKKTQKLAWNIDNVLRYFYFRKNEVVLLSEELKVLDSLLNISKTRFGDKLIANVQVSNEALHQYIPHYTLITFVDNALNYGLEGYEGSWNLDVNISVSDNLLSIKIINSGFGCNAITSSLYHGDNYTEYGTIGDTLHRLKEYYRDEEKVEIITKPQKEVMVIMVLPI